MKKWFVFILVLLALDSFSQDKVLYLQNEYIKAGFLPDVGGRMVFLAPEGESNFLLSDSALWNESQSERVELKADTPFKPYNGFISWVGPQSAWWTKQDILPKKKEGADVWPPDPFLIYSNFEVIEHTNNLLVLQGTESPVSGVQLIKKYELDGNSIKIEVTAKNIRKNTIEWDLWSNSRFPAFSNFRVPVDSEEQIRIDAKENGFVDIVKYKFENGYFTFIPELPAGEKKQRISKAFIYPSTGDIQVQRGDWKLDINFEKVPLEKIHPEQALIEVYNCITSNGLNNVLELEHHSAYQTIKPGEAIKLKEVWTFEKKPAQN